MIKLKFNNDECKNINKMALPLILNSVTGMIIGLCDQAMVGHVSVEAFAAVGLIASTINSITGVLGCTSIAFNIMGAKFRGKNDKKNLYGSFLINFLISIAAGLAFFLLALLFGKPVLKNLYNLNGKTLVEGINYLYIFSLSLGLNMILFTFSAYLKIINKTKIILYANITADILNVIFDYILIFGHFGFPKMGMKGNAIGSILALVIAVIIYLVSVKPLRLFKNLKIAYKDILKETIKISLPLIGQEILESTLLVIIINSLLSHIGILEVSVFNMISLIVNIALMPMYSYSQTALTFVSTSLGAKDKASMKKTPRTCLCFALILFSIISIIILLFNSYIFRLITSDASLVKASVSLIGIALFSYILNIPNNVYKYCLQGVGKEKWVFYASVIINFTGAALMFISTQILNLKLYGIYASQFITFALLSVVFIYKWEKYRSKIFYSISEVKIC